MNKSSIWIPIIILVWLAVFYFLPSEQETIVTQSSQVNQIVMQLSNELAQKEWLEAVETKIADKDSPGAQFRRINNSGYSLQIFGVKQMKLIAPKTAIAWSGTEIDPSKEEAYIKRVAQSLYAILTAQGRKENEKDNKNSYRISLSKDTTACTFEYEAGNGTRVDDSKFVVGSLQCADIADLEKAAEEQVPFIQAYKKKTWASKSVYVGCKSVWSFYTCTLNRERTGVMGIFVKTGNSLELISQSQAPLDCKIFDPYKATEGYDQIIKSHCIKAQ